jgi:hypothetical protein
MATIKIEIDPELMQEIENDGWAQDLTLYAQRQGGELKYILGYSRKAGWLNNELSSNVPVESKEAKLK